jgi:hypothetical protein
VHRDCTSLIRTLPKLPRDEKNPEDVDTDAEDHPYDGIRYGFMVRTPEIEREDEPGFDENKHPGFDEHGRRKRPWEIDPSEYTTVGASRYSRDTRPDSNDGGYSW